MRKAFFLIILVLFLGICSVALADTECSLAPCSGSVTIPDSKYTILTPDNIGEHADLISAIGKTKEDKCRWGCGGKGSSVDHWWNVN